MGRGPVPVTRELHVRCACVCMFVAGGGLKSVEHWACPRLWRVGRGSVFVFACAFLVWCLFVDGVFFYRKLKQSVFLFWEINELMHFTVLAPRATFLSSYSFGAQKFFFHDVQFLARAVLSCLRLIVSIRIHLSPPSVSPLLSRSSWRLAKNVVSNGDRA